METIAVINQKGGTAKTSTAAALAAGLEKKGFRVLMVDLDPQSNLSYIVGADTKRRTIADLLQQAADPEAEQTITTQGTIQITPQGHILAGNPGLAAADTILAETAGKEYLLKGILAPVQRDFDYCIVDTPPTLGTLTINALTAAQRAIAPAQADIFSLLAFGQLSTTIDTVKKYTNPALKLSGIVLTRYSGRAVLSREIAEKLSQAAEQYGTRLYDSKIRECIALKEAETLHQSIFDYAPRSNAAKDYNALLNEILGQE